MPARSQTQITFRPFETGLQGFPEAMSLLLDEAMRIERTKHLGAAPTKEPRPAMATPMASSPKLASLSSR